MLLKILCVILLGIGAVLVYGARFIAAKIEMQNSEAQRESIMPAVSENDSAEVDEEQKITSSPAVLKFKVIGMVFVVVGVILVLVAFR